jgi:RNA polymerase sigma-70 factor (ECF subfamily)
VTIESVSSTNAGDGSAGNQPEARQPSDAEGSVSCGKSADEGAVPLKGGATASHDLGNELMLALQRGERPALNRLFALYNPKLYSFILRIVGDQSAAEDIVQETWMALYERRDGYQPTFKFSTWLFTIARRKALSELRRRSVRSVVRSLTFSSRGSGETEDMELPQRTFVDPDVTADGALVATMVERALGMLSPQQREIVVLRDIEGFENEELATIMQWNLKPGALRKRIFDAREAFRRAMAELGYND